MLLLIYKKKIHILIGINLNTSNVTVNRQSKTLSGLFSTNLNTSNVTVNLPSYYIDNGAKVFKYI